jgi:hypothetical protein
MLNLDLGYCLVLCLEQSKLIYYQNLVNNPKVVFLATALRFLGKFHGPIL